MRCPKCGKEEGETICQCLCGIHRCMSCGCSFRVGRIESYEVKCGCHDSEVCEVCDNPEIINIFKEINKVKK